MRKFTKAARTHAPIERRSPIESLEPRRLLSASPANVAPLPADPIVPASLGDRVWRDANANGLQDAGEVGAPNVPVTLYDAATGTQLQATATSSTGQYAFTNITPGQGVYVQVTPISGYFVSPTGRGLDPAADNDAHPVTWRTPTLTLAPGEARTDIDVGIIQAARVTGTIFHDANENGVRDTGEPSLLGWSAFADLDDDGRPSAGEPTSALSNPVGLYSLFPLPPGAVTVRVVPSPAADPLWDAPAAKVATLVPGQQIQSFDLAATTPVFRGQPRQAGAVANPAASISGNPHVALDSRKRAVVAWASGNTVLVQRFDAAFTPLGPATTVATATSPQHVRVAVSPAGDFVVSWAVLGGSYARRYAPDGTPVIGGAVLIAPPTYTDRPAASVAVLDGGDYLLVREDYTSTHHIYLERFDVTGARVGDPVRVNQATTANSQPAVAVDATGRILVTWTGTAAVEDSGTDVFARLFTADAVPASDEIRVNTFVPGDQRSAVLAAAGEGRFVVAWGGPTEAQGGPSIYAQRLDGATLVGREIIVDRVNTMNQEVSAAPSGDFVVADIGTSSPGALLRFYSAAGVPAAPIRVTAALGTYSIGRPAVAFDPDGDFVGVWREYRSDTQVGPRGLLAGRFVVPPALIAPAGPPTAAPGAIRLRLADPDPTPPTAAELAVQNLTTGRLLGPTEYTWNYNPATSTADFKLLGVGTASADGNYRLTIPAAAVTDVAGNTMTGDFTFDFFVLGGDANGDRTVNFTDLLALARNYNGSNKTWADGDFTGDGVVNFNDLLILAKSYNQALPTPSPVAAPATTLLTTSATTASVLRDDTAPRPVFSTTRVTKPAPPASKPSPVKAKVAQRPK